ncbi:hypothetical protein V0R37_02380 [Pollutimonas sp. H1-120]|uniref:hypothetical protein n=1 Tax=Pollutimonas sp. H1-120 TaxID=3148824 RepID=UPI003B52DE97
MIEKIETLDELASRLSDDPSEFHTASDLVDALVDLGNTDKVYVRHDDHLGLKMDLSSAFLCTSIDKADALQFEEDVNRVLGQANIIIPLSERLLNADDLDEIAEDRARLGLSE